MTVCTSHCRSFGIALAVLILCGASHATATDPSIAAVLPAERTEGIWRCASHGGRNCLLFMLYMHGQALEHDPCPEAIDARDLPNTAPEILARANRLRFPLLLRSVAPEDLDNVPLPAIIHLDGADPNRGSFHVLVRVDPKIVFYINGPAAALASEERELFLRKWSGTIMIPLPANPSFTSWPTFVGFTLAFVLTLFGTRIRRKSIHGSTAPG